MEEEILVAFNQRVFQNVFGLWTIIGVDLKQAANESREALAIDARDGVVGSPDDDLTEALDAEVGGRGEREGKEGRKCERLIGLAIRLC